MSFEITTAFVEQYGSNVEFLVQQKGSRLRDCVALETGIRGKTAYFDQIGAVAARKVTQRHGDSPLNSTPHARRRVAMHDYETGDLIDDLDRLKTLIDPTSSYAQAHAWAMGRGIDDEIINAAFGTAYAGEDGSTQISFPAGQQVAVNSWAFGTGTGDSGLTISKLIEAKVLLDSADVDPDEERYIAVTAQQLGDLLQTTEATSQDFNSVKALVEGRIDTFMGFRFKRLERLLVNGSSHRRVIAWAKSGIKLGIGQDIRAQIAPRPDKRFSQYAYFAMSIGATRMQEDKVVEIVCDEP
ncbi:MAG: phage capsid protein [Halieaceae bacterium]|jgi:hypothetical protein|nr:phage capsid protein [Halieaceae bacterium]